MGNATGNIHVAEGNFIDETTYRQRAKKSTSLDLSHIKIDYFDTKNLIIREVKKSTKLEHVHIAQVKYYIYVMEGRGVSGITGLIEYPKSKKTTKVDILIMIDQISLSG
jgi:CRISPR-associated exonuclease Cas4